MEFGNPIVGQEDLIRSGIKSPNFNTDPETGAVQGWRIGQDGSAAFYNLTIGSTNYNIDQDGNAVFQSVSADDIVLNGIDLGTILDNAPKGIYSVTSLVGNSAPYTGTPILAGVCVVQNPYAMLRTYEITWRLHLDNNLVSSTFIDVDLYAKANGVPTTADIAVQSFQYSTAGTQADVMTSETQYFNLAANSFQVFFGLYISAATAGVSPNGLRLQDDGGNFITVKDYGAAPATQTYTVGGGGTPTNQYVKTYACNESASYQEDADNRGVSECYQGRYSSTNGNQYSMIGFDDATIRADLAGATINKVELYLNNNHFYSNSGGNAVIGTHNQTTLSGSHSSSQITDNLQQTHFDLGQAKWITIPNSIGDALKNNTAKGIALGPGPTTSQSYYGYFAGNGQSGEPQLRITYTK